MGIPETETGALRSAAEHGRISALAVDCQRGLQDCAQRHAELFPGGPFDPRLISGVTLANAFGSPEATADELSVACRSSLWVFAADWLVDYAAKDRAEIDALTGAVLAVADGGDPQVPLAGFLAEIRDDLARRPAFPELRARWRAQLERYMAAMTREWEWHAAVKGGGAAPTFDEYVANADNFGSTLVNLSHWIMTCGPAALDRFDALWAASGTVQRVLRLLNDLATLQRDLEWGDLNPLMLGATREDVVKRIDALVEQSLAELAPLRAHCPRETAYLERQIGFSTGFYGRTDYWGDL
ncbi:terpene synthase [Actinomadura sp. LD22]|uniref:Terpene synthase n=1 Tax=Actinomadura physcomitrii TaxID=2650748 RepID=A0A6I4MDY2_9ACTN|nr:terpene synthase [Actinomadura physcomitrii]MWA02031.1 terpene synthase [Actinomadura physcomitrii]